MKRILVTLLVSILFFLGISACEEITEPKQDPKICEVEVFTTNLSYKQTHYEVIKEGELTVERVEYYGDNGFTTIINPTKFPLTLDFNMSNNQDSVGIYVKAKVYNGKITAKLAVTTSAGSVTQEDACSQYVQ